MGSIIRRRRWLFRGLFLLAAGLGVALVWFAVKWRNQPTYPTTGTVPWPSDDPVWHVKHAAFVTAAEEEGFEVVCLGDSLTWGWDDHRDLWAERVTPRRTAFFAIGGETTNGLLWRIDDGELSGRPPKLVMLLVGTNNRWVKDDPADIAAGIAAVVGRIRERQPTAKVLVLGVLPQGWTAGFSSRKVFAAVNERLRALDDGRRLFVRDVGACLLEPDGSFSTTISSDGTHLTRAGYERLADTLAPLVKELCVEDVR